MVPQWTNRHKSDVNSVSQLPVTILLVSDFVFTVEALENKNDAFVCEVFLEDVMWHETHIFDINRRKLVNIADSPIKCNHVILI